MAQPLSDRLTRSGRSFYPTGYLDQYLVGLNSSTGVFSLDNICVVNTYDEALSFCKCEHCEVSISGNIDKMTFADAVLYTHVL